MLCTHTKLTHKFQYGFGVYYFPHLKALTYSSSPITVYRAIESQFLGGYMDSRPITPWGATAPKYHCNDLAPLEPELSFKFIVPRVSLGHLYPPWVYLKGYDFDTLVLTSNLYTRIPSTYFNIGLGYHKYHDRG